MPTRRCTGEAEPREERAPVTSGCTLPAKCPAPCPPALTIHTQWVLDQAPSLGSGSPFQTVCPKAMAPD